MLFNVNNFDVDDKVPPSCPLPGCPDRSLYWTLKWLRIFVALYPCKPLVVALQNCHETTPTFPSASILFPTTVYGQATQQISADLCI
ncbi:hypothetical protein [Leptolyngbya sp. NM2-A1]|uniref:hypothetical protein n=1 Tax=Leptolyngbya sp. NM2-A1 TaxID=2933909 RepID=UPI003298B048